MTSTEKMFVIAIFTIPIVLIILLAAWTLPEHYRKTEACEALGGVVISGRDRPYCVQKNTIIEWNKL